MNNIIKFLLIPITIIVTNINSNNCYSIEDNNIITNNIPQNNKVITYLDNGPANENATFKQWTTRANFNPIDAYSGKYDNFHTFCEEHNLQQFRDGVRGFLVDIYNLAHSLINNTTMEGNYDDIDNFITEWINQRTVDNLNLAHLEKQSSCSQCIHINDIKSIIRTAQKKLNPNKYYENNSSNDINFENNSLKLMECCYYFANQLIQLTHDILYALNNKVNAYKIKQMSDKEIYIDFKNYLINKIINPCYLSLVQAFLLFVNSENNFAINNTSLVTNYDEITRDFLDNLKKNCNMKDIKYKFIYNISNLRMESLRKNNELLNNLNNSTKEVINIVENIHNKFLKRLNISEIKRIISQYNFIVKITSNIDIVACVDDREITSNNDIINMANKNLAETIFFNIQKDICTNFDIMLKRDAISYMKSLNNNKEEEKKFLAEYTKFLKAINDLKHVGDNINIQIPNKDYISEIKDLLERIG